MSRQRSRRPGRLRITQICAANHGGGWVADFSVGLRERGYDVNAIVASSESGLATRLSDAGIRYEVVGQRLRSESRVVDRLGELPVLGQLRVIGDAGALLRRAQRMAVALRRLETDIATAHIHSSMLIARLAGLAARTPARSSMVPGPYHLESPLLALSDRLTHRLDHLVIAGSEHVAELYRRLGVPDERLAYTYYGPPSTRFDPTRFDRQELREELLGLSPATPLIGQVAYFRTPRTARHEPESIRGRGHKGHEDFIEAARIVLAERPDARFILVGSGVTPAAERYQAQLENQVRELGIAHAVRFLGERDDVPELLACMDVAVQCSLLENLGGTIESLLMATPTIATRVGGMPESVRDGKTGLLVAPRAPAELAAAMLRLIDQPALGERLGRAGRELMLDRFTLASTIDDLDGFYRQLAERRGLPAVNGASR